MQLQILFGSQSGNAQNLAHLIGEGLAERGVANSVFDMADKEPETLLETELLLIITSTYGDGEAPDNASEWMSYLKFSDELNLSHLMYAVLGLGDTYYPHFCQAAKDFDLYLARWGARALVPRLDCDLYYEEQYGEWLESLVSALQLNKAQA
jgi:sulfite reductase (NADPH) flavoprotein alpha-component